jgi:uncharacterized membrane protein
VPIYILAFLIGVVAGLRAMTAPAVVSWAAHLGRLNLYGTPFAFLGLPVTAYGLMVLAFGELLNDKLPKTPSRKSPLPFAVRIVMGALSGAALAAPADAVAVGAVCGAIGGVVGTLGGYEFRRRLVKATGGKDLLIALLEDLVGIGLAFWIVSNAT